MSVTYGSTNGSEMQWCGMTHWLRAAAISVFAVTLPLLAIADPGQPIGAAVSIVNLVTAAFDRDTRTLQTGDNVRQDELIEVGTDANSEFKLNDDTKLALGPGARLKLDKFVYDADKAEGSIGVDLIKGAFRFITGAASKTSYVVRVPNASITVRGTIFDVYVLGGETTFVLLHEGGVKVCNDRGRCRDHDRPGQLLQINEKGEISEPVRWASFDGNRLVPFDLAFPFVMKPPLIDPSPVFTRDALLEDSAPKKIRRATDDDNDREKPKKKQTRKVEEKPKKTKSANADDSAPTVKTKPKKIKTANRKQTEDDEAVNKALGLAVGVGIGFGVGKMGRGGNNRGDGNHGDGNRGGGDAPKGNSFKRSN